MNNKCIHKLQLNTSFYCKQCAITLCSNCKAIHNHLQLIIPIESYINDLKASFGKLNNQIDNINNFQSLYDNFITLRDSVIFFSKQIDDCYQGMKSLLTSNTLGTINLTAKDILNSFQLISQKNEQLTSGMKIIELGNRVNESMKSITSIDKLVTQFNIDLSDFSIGLNMIVKYSQERQMKIENYYLMNNSHMNDFIKEKVKNENMEIQQKIELLEFENKQLYEINKYNASSIPEKEIKTQPIIDKPLIDFAKDEKEIKSFLQTILVNTFVGQSHYNIIDQYDLRSLVIMNLKQLNGIIKIPELNESEYKSEIEMRSSFITKGIIKEITASKIFKSYIDSLTDVLLTDLQDYIFKNKIMLYEGIENEVIHSFLKNSKSLKKLKVIDLKGVGLTDAHMYRIALLINNTTAADIYLQNNKIKDEGITILFKSINEMCKVKNIYLNNNSITPVSLSIFKEAIISNPKHFEMLKIVSFENNNIPNDKTNKELLSEIRKFLKATIHI